LAAEWHAVTFKIAWLRRLDRATVFTKTEGPASDPGVLALRELQKRNFFATLLLSQGVPMLLSSMTTSSCCSTAITNRFTFCCPGGDRDAWQVVVDKARANGNPLYEGAERFPLQARSLALPTKMKIGAAAAKIAESVKLAASALNPAER